MKTIICFLAICLATVMAAGLGYGSYGGYNGLGGAYSAGVPLVTAAPYATALPVSAGLPIGGGLGYGGYPTARTIGYPTVGAGYGGYPAAGLGYNSGWGAWKKH